MSGKRLYFWGILVYWLAAGGRTVQAIEMAVIPVSYYEKEGNVFALKGTRPEITEKIIERIGIYHDIREDRTGLNDRLAGVTESDARRVANHYEVNYVLYGTIKEDGKLAAAEFKIYDKRTERNEVFYVGDTSDQYDRLIETVCERILDWYHTDRDKVDRLRDEIREIQKELEQRRVEAESLRKRKSDDKKVESPIKEFSLRIPVRIGYWTYGKRDWVQLVQGTVEVNAGLEIYPKLQFPALLGMRNEFSWDLLAGYRHGTTGQEDVVDVHQVILNSMLAYHLNIYTANWLTVGLGVFYEYGKWHLEEAAYLQSVDYDQSLTGTSVSIDYAYRFNRYITFNMGTEFYFYFAAETSPVIRPRVGMVVTVTGGRYEE